MSQLNIIRDQGVHSGHCIGNRKYLEFIQIGAFPPVILVALVF